MKFSGVVVLSLLSQVLDFVQSFTPSVVLSGPVGRDLQMHAIPRSMAYRYLKVVQVDYIKKDCTKSILDEVNEARELLRDPKTGDWNVSLMVPNSHGSRENLFMVMYRTNNRFPTCYTVEAVVRNHAIGPGEGSITILDLERSLNQMVRDRRGHLQIHSLRSWAGGRYMKELEIEKKFLSDTLDLEHTTSHHSDSVDSRNFGDFST